METPIPSPAKKLPLKQKVEAILFSVGGRISLGDIARLARSREDAVREAVREKERHYAEHNSFRLYAGADRLLSLLPKPGDPAEAIEPAVQAMREPIETVLASSGIIGEAAQDVMQLLGAKTCDVYLNDTAYWRNIPANVWNYHIGGFQVIKKWLSYREQRVLGRALTMAMSSNAPAPQAAKLSAQRIMGVPTLVMVSAPLMTAMREAAAKARSKRLPGLSERISAIEVIPASAAPHRS